MRAHFTIAWSALILATAACQSAAPAPPSEQAPAQIEVVLRAQESAWNAGDIEGFMSAGYWNSPDLTFLSGGDWTRGYDAVLERQRASYVLGDKEMGDLVFSRLEIIVLGADVALARGHWHLTFSGDDTASGLFSLVLRRLPEGWRIVHDHTSLDSKGQV